MLLASPNNVNNDHLYHLKSSLDIFLIVKQFGALGFYMACQVALAGVGIAQHVWAAQCTWEATITAILVG